MIIATAPEIAWVLNLRGQDEEFSPIFIAYLTVSLDKATLFVDMDKVTEEVLQHLKSCGCEVAPIDKILNRVETLVHGGAKILMDSDKVNYALFHAARRASKLREGDVDNTDQIIDEETAVTEFMAIKNKTEIAGMKEAHIRDAVAIIEFLSWFEQRVAAGEVFTEVDVDRELTARRAAQPGFRGLSFPTIAGAGPNGAVIHYRAEEETCRSVDKDTLLLIDSGGQYDCGTTDVTRTFHLGQPTYYQQTCFTRVLQGHMHLAMACFPENTPGLAIDSLARMPLWKMGLDYQHGTGHGVGAYLCVHEGPIGISHRYTTKMAQHPLKAGMIVSNEPGYYEDGNFGIRIENLVLIKEIATDHSFKDICFLGFEDITLVPIQKKMVAPDLLSDEEIAWLNKYHVKVWETVSPRLSHGAKEWLRTCVSPFEPSRKAAMSA